MKIYVDGEVIFDGELEKGCGNQVFDYGMVIPVSRPETAPRASSPSADSGVGTGSGKGTTGSSPPVPNTSTLTHIDNVLFHSEDYSDNSGSHPVPPLDLSPPVPPIRSETRTLNHSVDHPVALPIVDTPRVPAPAQYKPPDCHQHRESTPRSRSHSRDRKTGEEEESGILMTPRSPAIRRRQAQCSQEEDDSITVTGQCSKQHRSTAH